jgi:hypothetical protein
MKQNSINLVDVPDHTNNDLTVLVPVSKSRKSSIVDREQFQTMKS